MSRIALVALALLVVALACFVWLGGERGGRVLGDEEERAASVREEPELAHPLANAASRDSEAAKELAPPVELPRASAQRERVESVAAEEHHELPLDASITLAGRVLDEHAAPVEGVLVCAFEARGSGSGSGSSAAADQTDADGRFELPGLERQSWSVRPQTGESLAVPVETLVDGTQGDARDVVLRIVRGLPIEGTIVWPDGRLVESGSLALSSGGAQTTTSFEGGHFETCEAPGRSYEIEVSAAADGVRGTASIEGVHAGDTGLRLVLEAQALFEVRGTVVDEQGRAVPRFTAVASNGKGSSACFGKDGSFVLGGLTAGEWDVDIRAKTLQGPEQRVLVGPAVPALRFALSAAGRVRGVVLDALGQPVAHARVSGDALADRTDARGRFEVFTHASPLHLHAERQGSAPSEELVVSVAAGAVLEDVVLRLREPCRLEGRLRDADGQPVGGSYVFLGDVAKQSTRTTRDGNFVFEDMPAGEARVFAGIVSSGSVARARVVLTPAMTSAVELRLERADPVRIHGRLVGGTKPLSATLQFTARAACADVDCDADGRFETTFACPGPWRCAVGAGADVRVLDFVVPDVEEYELTLDLDAMRRVESLDELDY